MDLLLAVAENDIERTRHLLQAGFDVNTPILWTAKNTYSPIIPANIASRPELLARIQSDQEYHALPLNIAVIGGHGKMVRLLLGAGADINMKDERGRTALICATFGLDINVSDINTSNLDLISQTHDTHFLIMKILLRHPNLYVATLNFPQYEISGITPLCLASYLGKPEIIELLLDDGRVDVNGTDSKNATALMYAARDGNLPIVRILLSYDASPDITDSHGWSAIQYAANNPDIVQICEGTLRRKRPDISMIHAPLNPIARYYGSYTSLSALISSLPNCQSSLSHLEINTLQEIDTMDTFTAPIVELVQMAFLHAIKSHDHASLQTLLLWSPPIKRVYNRSSGALLINHQDSKTGMTAIHHALRAQPLPSLDTISMLYQAGADINAQTCYGRTALHYLARITIDEDGNSCATQKKWTRPVTDQQPHHASSTSQPNTTTQNRTNITTSSTSIPLSDYRLSTLSASSSLSAGSGTTHGPSLIKAPQGNYLQSILVAPTTTAHLGLCASLLIRLGALVNIADVAGNTPLHFAAEFGGITEVLEILILDGNADLHLENKKHQTPLDICKTEEIRLFMLALEKERKGTGQINSIDLYDSAKIDTDISISHTSNLASDSTSRHISKSTAQSLTMYGIKNGVQTHDHSCTNSPISVLSSVSETTAANQTKKTNEKDNDLNQIDLIFKSILKTFFCYHMTYTYSIDKALACINKTILQSRKNDDLMLMNSLSPTQAVHMESQKRLLEQTIVQLRCKLRDAHDMFGETEGRMEQVMLHYRNDLIQVERLHQAGCKLLELQQDKVEKLYDVLGRMDMEFCQLEEHQNGLIAQVEYLRLLALRQLRWLEQNGDRVTHDATMDSTCLKTLMQSLNVLSALPASNDPTLYPGEDYIRLSHDLNQTVQKIIERTASSSQYANARTALVEKWHQVASLLVKQTSAAQGDGNDMEGTTKVTVTPFTTPSSKRTTHCQHQLWTTSLYSMSLKPTSIRNHRSLNELELSFDILNTNLCEIQKDMDDLNTQSSHVMESKKHMYDACLALEKELEVLEKSQPPQRIGNTTTTTTRPLPLTRTPTIVRGELDQVMQCTQTLLDRQSLLDQEAATLKKEYDNIEYQLEIIKEALSQVRLPILLQGLLDRLGTEDEPTVYVEKDWKEDEALVATFTEDRFEHHPMDLADESDSTSISSSSSIFSSGSNDNTKKCNKNSTKNGSSYNVMAATQMKYIFKTSLSTQCLLSRLDASLYSLKVLATSHLRRSRYWILAVQVSLAQVSEDVKDACHQMAMLFDNADEVAQRMFDLKTEVETVIQHRREEIVKVCAVVDEVAAGTNINPATQKHQRGLSLPSQKFDTDIPSENQQSRRHHRSTVLTETNDDQQQLILCALGRLQAFNERLQLDVEVLKRKQAEIYQRISYANASLIETQVDRLIGRGDSSLLSVSNRLNELMNGIRLQNIGLCINGNSTDATTLRNTNYILSLPCQRNTISNASVLSNKQTLDRLSILSARPSRTAKTTSASVASNKRIPTASSATLSSLSSYQQERMLSHASTLSQALGRKQSSNQHHT